MASKKSTTFSLQSLALKENKIEEEGLANWIFTVVEKKTFRSLPSYFTEYTIPPGTQRSKYSEMVCYNKVNAYFKSNEKLIHPSKAIEIKLSEGTAQFSPLKMIDSVNNVYVVKRGLFLPEVLKDELSHIAPALIASVLPYHVKFDSDKKLIPMERPDDYKRLGWHFPDLTSFRLQLKNTTKSPIVAQGEIFAQVRGDSAAAIHMLSGIYSKATQFSMEANESLQKFMNAKYVASGFREEERHIVRLPKGVPLQVIRKSADPSYDLWTFLNHSRMKRGEDNAGIGVMSIGYYFADMPREIVKNISMLYDLRAVMCYYGVKHIFLTSEFSEYVKRALVENGFSVICEHEISLPAYQDKPGIYQSLPGNVSAVVVRSLLCNRPDVAKKIVIYPEVDVSVIKTSLLATLGNGSRTSSGDEKKSKYKKKLLGQRHVIVKLPLIPKLNNPAFSLFPTTMPHNGYVWVAPAYGEGSFDFEKLLYRGIAANIYRNQYPLNRLNYWTIDPAQEFFDFGRILHLPKLSLGKKKDDEHIYEFGDEGIDPLKQSAAVDDLKVDFSAFVEKSADKDIYRAGDLIQIVSLVSKEFIDPEDLRQLIITSYANHVSSIGPVNHSLKKLFNAYSPPTDTSMKGIETIYQAFGFEGFIDDYREYLETDGAGDEEVLVIDDDDDDGDRGPSITVPQSQTVEQETTIPDYKFD